MSLTRFCATPSGRYVCNAANEPVLRFEGNLRAEANKRILLTGCHLRPILGERAASAAGRSPIPVEAFDPAIRSALGYLGSQLTANPAILAGRTWALEGEVTREYPSCEIVAVLLVPAPEGFEALMVAPQLCAAAVEILAGSPASMDVEALLAA